MDRAATDASPSVWAELKDQPFDLLLAIETRVRATKLDLAAGQTQSWTGLAFRLRERWLVAPREDVREVVPLPRLTRVPGARPWMMGVANVRGSLLPVTDLGGLLGQPAAIESRAQRVLVFNSDRLPAGLLVDEVVGYRSFAATDQRPERVGDDPVLAPYLLGAFFRDDRRWLVLSLHRLTRDPMFTQAGQ